MIGRQQLWCCKNGIGKVTLGIAELGVSVREIRKGWLLSWVLTCGEWGDSETDMSSVSGAGNLGLS